MDARVSPVHHRFMEDMGADVTSRIYPGMGHTVSADELEFMADMVGSVG